MSFFTWRLSKSCAMLSLTASDLQTNCVSAVKRGDKIGRFNAADGPRRRESRPSLQKCNHNTINSSNINIHFTINASLYRNSWNFHTVVASQTANFVPIQKKCSFRHMNFVFFGLQRVPWLNLQCNWHFVTKNIGGTVNISSTSSRTFTDMSKIQNIARRLQASPEIQRKETKPALVNPRTEQTSVCGVRATMSLKTESSSGQNVDAPCTWLP